MWWCCAVLGCPSKGCGLKQYQNSRINAHDYNGISNGTKSVPASVHVVTPGEVISQNFHALGLRRETNSKYLAPGNIFY